MMSTLKIQFVIRMTRLLKDGKGQRQMLAYHTMFDKIVEGWERSETDVGIPYYVCHKLESTSWNHPFYQKILQELDDYRDIKYAAYRTAFKIRHLQKKLKLNHVGLRAIQEMFSCHGYPEGCEELIGCEEMLDLLTSVYQSADQSAGIKIQQTEIYAEFLQNLILNLFDINRSGCVRVISMKLLLIVLSSARLADKYRAFYHELTDPSTYISSRHFTTFLQDLSQLPDLLQEGAVFGGDMTPAVNSCINMNDNSVGISEDVFYKWLLKEPQTLVWLPTFHRIAASETVKHESKCNICKSYPIIGFRYRCLQCFNFDMCQNCFYTGCTKKNHKLKHPIQEYCLATTAKVDTKAFLKTLRNNLSKKHRKKSKMKYLPILAESNLCAHTTGIRSEPPAPNIHEALLYNARQLAQSESQSQNKQTSDGNKAHVKSESVSQHQQHLEEIIRQLQEENRRLHAQIHCMKESSDTESNLSGKSEQQRLQETPGGDDVFSRRHNSLHQVSESESRLHSVKQAGMLSPISPVYSHHSDDSYCPPYTGLTDIQTYDSLDYLEVSPSHFTLPSLTNSRACLDEEEEMDNLVQKMQLVFPNNMSYSTYSMSKCGTVEPDEMLQAASTIGNAMSEFVSEVITPQST